jgi:type III secretory pathway component EscT
VKQAGLLEALARLLDGQGVDLAAWGLSWARVAPVVAIVPAFGLRALSGPARAALSLLFAVVILPAVRPEASSSIPFASLLLVQLARGSVVALAAAIPLWAATMAGGAADALRGSQDLSPFPTIEGRATPLGILFSLLAAVLFLGLGGPARVVGALATGSLEQGAALSRAASDLAAGIGIAVAVAAPLLAASVILELAGALVARAASPAHLHTFLAPIRSLVLLTVTALLFERMATFLALFVQP